VECIAVTDFSPLIGGEKVECLQWLPKLGDVFFLSEPIKTRSVAGQGSAWREGYCSQYRSTLVKELVRTDRVGVIDDA